MLLKKILIIRFSSIGDIVLTTPVVRCVKNKYPNSEVHFLTKASFAGVVNSNPYLAKVHSFEKDLTEAFEDLQNESYDYVVDLHKNIRSKRVVKLLKVPSENYPKLNYEKWLLTNFKVNKLPNIHIVDRYFEAVKPIEVSNDFKGLDFFIHEKNKVEKPFDSYAVIVVGAAHTTKALTVSKIAEIILEVNHNVVLIGGSNDAEKANEVIKVLKDNDSVNILSKCGLYNIEQSASAMKQSSFVITPDTGMMHIASALDKPIISVWGNTVPDFGMYPYMPHQPEKVHIVEVANLKCRPCSKIGFDKCPKKHFKCINDINATEIGEVVRQRQF